MSDIPDMRSTPYKPTFLGIFLIVFIAVAGIGSIHQTIHCDAEKDHPQHDSLTCPQCQMLKSLGAEASLSVDVNSCLILEPQIISILSDSILSERPIATADSIRAPPAVRPPTI